MKRQPVTVQFLPGELALIAELAERENVSLSRWICNASIRVAVGKVSPAISAFPSNEAEQAMLRAVFIILQILNEANPPEKRKAMYEFASSEIERMTSENRR